MIPPCFGLAIVLMLALGGPVGAQQMPEIPDDEELAKDPVRERLKALNNQVDPKTGKRERVKPDFEFYRGQIAPFDVLPYVKEHHWNSLGLELKANHFDYDGQVQTGAVKLAGMPHAVRFQRDVHLLKGKEARTSLQVMFPEFGKLLGVELSRPEAIRPQPLGEINLLKLDPHQMLVAVIGKDAPSYQGWQQRLQAFRHVQDGPDLQEVERNRYYRLVIGQKPDEPLLSPHPLTWTTLSHVIWDGQSPDKLSIAQQQAMIDWIYWGGQLVLMGGPGSGLNFLADSFLGPYLPADPSGETISLTEEELEPLSRAYPAPPSEKPFNPDNFITDADGKLLNDPTKVEMIQQIQFIQPLKEKPLYVEGLRAREGSIVLPLSESDPRAIAVERRVGRGRVMIVAARLHDPAFARWSGLDTFVRRVILRRPEEVLPSAREIPRRFLSGQELSWVRYLARDLGAPDGNAPNPIGSNPPGSGVPNGARNVEMPAPHDPVAAWLDDAEVPRLAREALSDASGISVPEHGFVLRVILAYAIALVPLNYLICRFLLRRREWAWVIVPVLALGFAFAVERAAAYDLGFDSACDEVDVLELHGGYPRAHLSRFAALYSTGRVRYTISYPGEPAALALPMNAGLGLRGQELEESSWISAPVPELVDFQVQPRSLAMFRAEQMIDLGGRIEWTEDGDVRTLANLTDLDLRDAEIVDLEDGTSLALGSIAPGRTVDVGPLLPTTKDEDTETDLGAWAKVDGLYDRLHAKLKDLPQESGELRLVAWTPTIPGNESIEPAVDRRRGMTLVVAHLRFGRPPDPAGPSFVSPVQQVAPRSSKNQPR